MAAQPLPDRAPGRHPLLTRQIRKHLFPSGIPEEKLSDFLDAVDRAYRHADETRQLTERSLFLMSQELNARLDEKQAREADLKREKSEQSELIKRLEEAHNKLLQSEKMASIGQLAAGVAHEINNPIGFVNSNLGTLREYVMRLLNVLAAYEAEESGLPDEATHARLAAAREAADLAYVKEDLATLLAETSDGIARVRRIVQDLKDFSHSDQGEWMLADLHKGLETTLNVVNNEIKYKAQVIKQYSPLPMLRCLPSQLNQVFMNLLVNAAHAIESHGTITISTGCDEQEAWVEIADTGCGIPGPLIKRIFDPFFTTKPVGKGTGLGLSISYGIVQKHGGHIDVHSEPGKGTAFRICLPLHQTSHHASAELSS